MTELLVELADWAYQRHQNVLSWYVRLCPVALAWFAYRRSGWGIAGTLVALATSMFWFPAPARPDPRVTAFLRFEQEWLSGDWTAGKVLLTLLVPAFLGAYCLAFWRRSLVWGLVLLNAMAVGKLLWGVVFGDGTGWAMAAPMLAGLVVGNAVLIGAGRWLRTRHDHRIPPEEPRLATTPSRGDRSGQTGRDDQDDRT